MLANTRLSYTNFSKKIHLKLTKENQERHNQAGINRSSIQTATTKETNNIFQRNNMKHKTRKTARDKSSKESYCTNQYPKEKIFTTYLLEASGVAWTQATWFFFEPSASVRRKRFRWADSYPVNSGWFLWLSLRLGLDLGLSIPISRGWIPRRLIWLVRLFELRVLACLTQPRNSILPWTKR